MTLIDDNYLINLNSFDNDNVKAPYVEIYRLYANNLEEFNVNVWQKLKNKNSLYCTLLDIYECGMTSNNIDIDLFRAKIRYIITHPDNSEYIYYSPQLYEHLLALV